MGIRKLFYGTFLVVQWLRLHIPMQQLWARSLVGELRFPHALWPKNQNKEQKQYCNKFNTDLKMIHIKKKILKKQNIFIKLMWEINEKKINTLEGSQGQETLPSLPTLNHPVSSPKLDNAALLNDSVYDVLLTLAQYCTADVWNSFILHNWNLMPFVQQLFISFSSQPLTNQCLCFYDFDHFIKKYIFIYLFGSTGSQL